ncbi:MAG: hypothetical protein ACTHMJ_23955 [Thermomicrobiales bacterium]
MDMMAQERLKEQAIVALARRRLETQEGLALPAGRAPVGNRADGTPRQHLFDLAAADGSVIGEIRTYTLGEGGGRPAGKFAHCYAACLFLLRARARRRVLVLTDHAFWARFRRESEGIVNGIEILHVPVDETLPIVTEEEEESLSAPSGHRDQPRSQEPRGFEPADTIRVPRRNKGGPGPRGRRPNTGQRRPPERG